MRVDCTCPRARHQHGTALAYSRDGCHCDDCTRAARRERKLRIMYGVRRLVPADEARAHIQRLQRQGMSQEAIAERAGVTSRTIVALLREGQECILASNARAILAVKAEPSRDGFVDSIGATRRARALVALGWHTGQIAEVAGCNRSSIMGLLHQQNPSTRFVIADGMRRAYDELWDKEPPQDTPHERRVVVNLRNRARRNGWALPMAWDDETIDDPDAVPQGMGTDRHETPASREARWRMELGEPLDAIARDLGVTRQSLERAIERDEGKAA